MSTKGLPDIKTDFSAWYNEVITQTEMVDASPTRGCVVLRPYGYAIWEHIKTDLDLRIKNHGVENAYFPLFIPESFLKKEAEHVEGFAPELAVVTHAGGKQLEEPYVVRPTSETIVYYMFARWITSWRDLPLKINQWANVVRWELRTRPFLRTTEILWQEGHTAHATREEGDAMARAMLATYVEHIEKVLGIPLFVGRKTAKERFAGAAETYCMEAMMPDGKALQMGTSHLLSQSFPAAYGVQFQDKDLQVRTPWCTSWGMTTRLVGATVMVHGDQEGLVLPPGVAPHQVVIVPIYRTTEEQVNVAAACEQMMNELRAVGVRVHLDDRPDVRPGAKFFKWEQRGVPLRIEIGPRDLAQQLCTLVVRSAAEGQERKRPIILAEVVSEVTRALEQYRLTLIQRAKAYMAAQTHEMQFESVAAFGARLDATNGFYRAAWCGGTHCEELLTEYKGGIRCILDAQPVAGARCFGCNKAPLNVVIIAKGY